MALLFCDGFPYDTSLLTPGLRYNTVNSVSSGLTIQTTNGRFGGRWLQVYGGNQTPRGYLIKNIGSSSQTLCVQFGYKAMQYTNVASWVFELVDLPNGTQITLVDDNGWLKVYRGLPTSNLLGTASQQLTMNIWHQIEFKVKIDPSAGTVLLKLDGTTVLNLSTQNTRATANSSANGFEISDTPVSTGAFEFGFSDFIFMNDAQVGGQNYCNDLLGSRRVFLAMPTADGNYKEWTRSAGADNYANVDEVPPNDDTDYNKTGSVGARDTFAYPDLPNVNATVNAVVCDLYARNLEAGAGKLKGLCRSNGVDGEGTEITVPDSYNWGQSVLYLDPNTSAPFTAAAVNAAEFGYKRSA